LAEYGAELWRVCVLVVALSMTAAPTSALAREFRASDTQKQDYPTVQALNRLLGGFVPAMNVSAMPFLFRATEHRQKVLVVSQRAGNSLSEEDQKIFREAATTSSQFVHQKWRDFDERSRDRADQAGVIIIRDFDRKPFQAAMISIHEKAQRDPATAALIDRIRKTE